MEYDDVIRTGESDAWNLNMSTLAPKKKQKIIVNTIEELKDVGKKTAERTVKEVVDTFSFGEFIGLSSKEPTEQQQRVQKEIADKTAEVQKEKGADFTSEDAEKIAKETQELEEARKRLFDIVKSDEAKQIQRNRDEEARKKQEEIQEEQREAQETQRLQQMQQQEGGLPQGKVRKSILGGKPKKSTPIAPQNFENKANKGK